MILIFCSRRRFDSILVYTEGSSPCLDHSQQVRTLREDCSD
jgi:hypothetical protein